MSTEEWKCKLCGFRVPGEKLKQLRFGEVQTGRVTQLDSERKPIGSGTASRWAWLCPVPDCGGEMELVE